MQKFKKKRAEHKAAAKSQVESIPEEDHVEETPVKKNEV